MEQEDPTRGRSRSEGSWSRRPLLGGRRMCEGRCSRRILQGAGVGVRVGGAGGIY